MSHLDECGWPLLVETVRAHSAGTAIVSPRNQLRRPQESILSIATAARRTGRATVVVGATNLRVDCRYQPATDDFLWWAGDVQKAPREISFLLDAAQGSQP